MRAQQRRIARTFQKAAADHQANRLADAERGYREILREAPGHVDSLHGLGLLALQHGRADLAIAYIGQVTRAAPHNARAHLDLGLALAARGHHEEARAAVRVATLLDPDDPLAQAALGDALVRLNRLEEALAAYRQALAVAPTLPAARSAVGFLLREQGRLEEAVVELRRAVALAPSHPATRAVLGATLVELERPEEAEPELRAALALTPDDAMVLNNLGLAQHARGDVTAAVATLTHARRLRQDLAGIAANLAAALRDAGALDAALREAAAALAMVPDNADAHFVSGTIHLAQGDFARGWAGFAWRDRVHRAPVRPPGPPAWDGSPLNGRTLLVRPEQGLGDMLQFCRYVPEIKGGRVVVAAPAPLLRLLRTLPGDAEIVSSEASVGPVDVVCSILDLPARFGTVLGSIPAAVPYLWADADAAARWQARLNTREGMRIGLCWAGGIRYQHDRRRSIPVESLSPLATVEGVCWVSLQKGASKAPELPLLDWTGELDDFADTAALVAALDLVITVDTAVAHLAGALGRPVWLLNRFGGDWRWLLDRNDSPWYPTLRQFRQPELHDWAGVIARIRSELTARVADKSLSPR
jgi:Flp pilus assembly protein TadD